ALAQVVVQAGGAILANEDALEAGGDGLDRGERVVDLVSEDTDEPLPRLPLLLAERAADVGEDDERVRQSALPELARSDLPSPAPSRERDLRRARPHAAVQAPLEPEVVRAPAEQPLGGACEGPLARAVDE